MMSISRSSLRLSRPGSTRGAFSRPGRRSVRPGPHPGAAFTSDPALPGGIVPDFVEHILKLPATDGWLEPAPDAESVNRSLGRDWIEYIRILNRRTALSQPVFARDDVLETALDAESINGDQAGIASWLSPAARRLLIATYSEGNAAIAREFSGRRHDRLFEESPPDADDHCADHTRG